LGHHLSQLIIGVLPPVRGQSTQAASSAPRSSGGRRTACSRQGDRVRRRHLARHDDRRSFGAFFAGSAVYSGELTSYSIGDPGVLRAVLSVGFYGGCVALIGIAVGFLLRSTAAAIGVLLGLLMLAPVLVGFLPGTIGDTLTKILPSQAAEAMMSVTSPDNLLSPWLGFAVLVAWVVGLLAIAGVTLRHRDA
jgi:hypothetical protein